MNTLLKLEELGIFVLSIVFFSQLDFAWWWFPLLLLAPDIGMLGYAINTKIGAFTYNSCHHRLVAATIAIVGLVFDNSYWQLAAIILFAHISMDRMLGFGLKYKNDFKLTHLTNL